MSTPEQETIFDANAWAVCAYIMGGSPNTKERKFSIWVDSEFGNRFIEFTLQQYVPDLRYLYGIHVRICAFGDGNIDRRPDNEHWLIRYADVALIFLTEPSIGRCKASLFDNHSDGYSHDPQIQMLHSNHGALFFIPEVVGIFWRNLTTYWPTRQFPPATDWKANSENVGRDIAEAPQPAVRDGVPQIIVKENYGPIINAGGDANIGGDVTGRDKIITNNTEVK